MGTMIDSDGESVLDNANTRSAFKKGRKKFNDDNSKPGEMPNIKVFEQSYKAGNQARRRAANRELMQGVVENPKAKDREAARKAKVQKNRADLKAIAAKNRAEGN